MNTNQSFEIDRARYDHYNQERLQFKAAPGINEELVRAVDAIEALVGSEDQTVVKGAREWIGAFSEICA